MKEEWRDIPGHPGYQASSLGRIRSLDRLDVRGHLRKGKLKKLSVLRSRYSKPYLTTRAMNSERSKSLHYVHRLVALTFHPNPDEKAVVNHINNDPQDNRAANLEWVTHSENNKHCPTCAVREADLVCEGAYY